MDFRYGVCIVGGCGHVGLPLALTFADRGLEVCIYDINDAAVAQVRAGRMPFRERGAEPVLERVIGRNLEVPTTPGSSVGRGTSWWSSARRSTSTSTRRSSRAPRA